MLAEKQIEIRRGEWRDPEAGVVSFRAYADKWVCVIGGPNGCG
ncbi:hypothetical protein GCM10010317_104070 [Streptomyces mirabilis]|nr:hypothetical protein GCM10010317_104070 [Streptomyces mirabilis]